MKNISLKLVKTTFKMYTIPHLFAEILKVAGKSFTESNKTNIDTSIFQFFFVFTSFKMKINIYM